LVAKKIKYRCLQYVPISFTHRCTKGDNSGSLAIDGCLTLVGFTTQLVELTVRFTMRFANPAGQQ